VLDTYVILAGSNIKELQNNESSNIYLSIQVCTQIGQQIVDESCYVFYYAMFLLPFTKNDIHKIDKFILQPKNLLR
jgi:hypothetical protein